MLLSVFRDPLMCLNILELTDKIVMLLSDVLLDSSFSQR